MMRVNSPYRSTNMNRIAPLWLTAFALVVAQANDVVADIIAPSGLQPGDSYHLIFITSQTIPGSSPTFSTYDSFANSVAQSAGLGLGGTLQWHAIVSTSNAYAAPTLYSDSFPVYNLHGQLVKSSPIDLWDFGADVAVGFDEFGNAVGTNHRVWTGFPGVFPPNPTAPGQPHTHQQLGGGVNPNFGFGDRSGRNTFAQFNAPSSQRYPIYAISDPLTVPAATVPEPASITVWAILISVAGIALRRRKPVTSG